MEYQAVSTRYDHMKYVRCGNSGLKLPGISLGLWHNFGDVDCFHQARRIVRRAFDLGITHFDLANNYGPSPGSAEENFGKIIDKDFRSYRDELIISTKAGYYMWPGPYGEWGSKKYLSASLDQSLKRLGLEYVDIFYSHRFDPDTPLEETMEALAMAVKQGKALYAGISNYPSEATEKAYDILRSMGVRCLIHQVKYSMLFREPENSLFDILNRLQMGCIVFSPLAQGLLTDRYLKGIPRGSRASKSHGFLKREEITGDMIHKIIQLNQMAGKRGQTLAQMALTWVLRKSEVTSALIGSSSVRQLEDNVACIRHKGFTETEIKKIDSILQ
ncbi:aldo/keto reductase [bacterium]|nr:aldo/keto reductase [bacterium]